jgi:hypothetical protein
MPLHPYHRHIMQQLDDDKFGVTSLILNQIVQL